VVFSARRNAADSAANDCAKVSPPRGVRRKVAAFASLDPSDLHQVLLTEYRPGVQIGWHKDKSHAATNPNLVKLAKQLRRKLPKGGQRSLRDVAAELAKLGYVNARGVTFSASSVQSMLDA